MAFKDRVSGSVGRKVLEGANTLVYTAVAVAFVVLVNWFVDRHNQRWDLTPSQKYSLSDQTKKILKGLTRDVSIYVFDRERGSRGSRDLIDNYKVVNPKVLVRYVDSTRDPVLAKQYNVRRDGTIIVAMADKQFEAQSETEEGVTNAIVRLLKEQKTVYFVRGHDERDVESPERLGYDRIKKALENENYQVKALSLLEKAELRADSSVVIIAGPAKDYLPQEIDAVRRFMGGGGRSLFMLDPLTDPRAERPANLVKLLADWNVTAQNDLVIEPNIQLEGAGLGMTVVLKYGSSPIVQPLARTATLFPLTRSFVVGKEYKAGISTDSLCETTPDSYGVADFNPKMREVTFRSGKDIKGPLSVAVSGTVTTGEGEHKKEGRFVAVGTSLVAANAYLGFPGNRDLVMNMVNWLSADEDLISIRPKPPESQELNLTSAQMRRLFFGGVLGLPLLIIAAGFTVWWRRRG